MTQANKTNGYQAPAVQKAFQVLELVSTSNQGIGVSEIAESLGFSKSTTFGITQALLKLKVLNQSEQGKKLFLGPTIVELSLRNWNYLKIRNKAQSILDALRDTTGETVFLGAQSHDRSLIIATAEAAKPIKITAPSGTTIPLLAGAVGKVFLALSDDEQCAEMIEKLGLRQFTPRSIVNEKKYMEELAEVRRQGYALDDEEYMPGVRAVAKSIGNLRGLPLAVWVVGFASSMDNKAFRHITDEIQVSAENLRNILEE